MLKAFARFDKTDASKPEPRLEALKDLGEQISKQLVALVKRKKELGDKPFALAKDKLHALLELAESEQKLTRAAAAESEGGADGEEADSPILLTKKMVPLVRELRKGEARCRC